jgi:hypothetical protein
MKQHKIEINSGDGERIIAWPQGSKGSIVA